MAANPGKGLPGLTIKLGLEEYVMAPITLGQFIAHESDFNAIYEADAGQTQYARTPAERYRLRATFVLLSLSRNYTTVKNSAGSMVDLTLDVLLDEILAVDNIDAAYNAAMRTSGMEPTAAGEAAAVAGSSESSTA